jgi:hypothetical protein
MIPGLLKRFKNTGSGVFTAYEDTPKYENLTIFERIIEETSTKKKDEYHRVKPRLKLKR